NIECQDYEKHEAGRRSELPPDAARKLELGVVDHDAPARHALRTEAQVRKNHFSLDRGYELDRKVEDNEMRNVRHDVLENPRAVPRSQALGRQNVIALF